jgi:hypothetical protein
MTGLPEQCSDRNTLHREVSMNRGKEGGVTSEAERNINVYVLRRRK